MTKTNNRIVMINNIPSPYYVDLCRVLQAKPDTGGILQINNAAVIKIILRRIEKELTALASS